MPSVDWNAAAARLDADGWAETGPLLSRDECDALVRLYDEEARFRSRVDMARFRFGEGEYKYFADPIPSLVRSLRERAYPHVAAVANRWSERLRLPDRYPGDLASFLEFCARRGQSKPTPLLLRYHAGGYNCLHQDLYGEVAFPIQLTVVLSRLEQDYTGGEFLIVEQRPRAQSRGIAVALGQGEGVLFPTRYRPIEGSRGAYRANVRHGVSPLRSGTRFSLGVIFHNAK